MQCLHSIEIEAGVESLVIDSPNTNELHTGHNQGFELEVGGRSARYEFEFSEANSVPRHRDPSFRPVVAYLGPALASLIGGTFVVEFIFGLPGLGQHFIKAVTNRDYTLIQGTVIVFASLILAFNMLSDIAQVWLDPRRKLKS